MSRVRQIKDFEEGDLLLFKNDGENIEGVVNGRVVKTGPMHFHVPVHVPETDKMYYVAAANIINHWKKQ